MLLAVPMQQSWFWEAAGVVSFILLALNLLLIVVVHGRRVQADFRDRRERQFRDRFGYVLDQLDPATRTRSVEWLRAQVRGLNALERPVAAQMLFERLANASSEEHRANLLAAVREAGGLELMLRSLRRRMPWRRALAAQALGLVEASEALPELLGRLNDDPSRRVREAALRALGRIGDERALSAIAELYLQASPKVSSGLVYEALVALDPARAGSVFVEGLRSEDERVRLAGCYGVVALLEPDRARPLLERALTDPAASVRAAAADSLVRAAGEVVPEALARASRDDQRTVRRAAVTALAAYDDPHAVVLATAALDDPDRDTALRAGESLVRLSRLERAGPAARTAIDASEQWPVQTALTLAALGAV